MLPNLALTAKMRAGKDEVFIILSELGFHVERIAFGDTMKECFYQTFPDIPQEPKPIEQLQFYGQAMRKIYPNVWVDKAMMQFHWRTQEFTQSNLTPPTFIFTDVRQPNEYEAVKRAGFIVVGLEALEETRKHRMLNLGEAVSDRIMNAKTEVHIDNFDVDYMIKNDGTREDLKREVMKLIKHLSGFRQIERL